MRHVALKNEPVVADCGVLPRIPLSFTAWTNRASWFAARPWVASSADADHVGAFEMDHVR